MFKALEFKNQKKQTLRGVVFGGKEKKGIIFVHGFERKSCEKKFKNIIDEIKGKYYSFLFDFSGSGLSDGDFEDFTVQKLSKELKIATEIFKKKFKINEIFFIAHSLGCAIVVKFLENNIGFKNSKIVFFAPALNQKELQKYWFVKSKFKEKEITWNNFKEYIDSNTINEFDKYIQIEERETKEHIISNQYFLENINVDYQDILKSLKIDFKNMLIIHGLNDDKVPIQSNYDLTEKIKTLVIKEGDHDLEKPSVVRKYIKDLVEFLKKV
ncbi:MAG: alpha/beta hydrolase [Patescibacteria group bacterium]